MVYWLTKGISEPDALLCCVDADASVTQHRSAGVGVFLETVALLEITAFTMNFGSFSNFFVRCVDM